MKALLIINDDSSEARHAGEFALTIARKAQTNIMLMNTSAVKKKASKEVVAGDFSTIEIESHPVSRVLSHLNSLNSFHKQDVNFRPDIEEFDVSVMTEREVIDIINKHDVWMMVKGMADVVTEQTEKTNINIHNVLNRVLCPLLLIPAHWSIKNIERMVYIADLRYCRVQVVKYLSGLAKPWNAAVSVAHMSAKGLPDMAEKYALSVFSEEISNNVNYDQLFFNNVKERDIIKAVDVMINGMHNDILVMVNHRFHFEEILGRYITDTLPLHITIPLFIFPY